jgi:diaminopimelate epimerase
MIPFRKMHGLGNDFIVFDARARPLALSAATVKALADRHTGVGADTIAVIEPPRSNEADVFVRFHNADGEEIGTCGNATRCVAALLFAETGRDQIVLATRDGLLRAQRANDMVAVDMGRPRLRWNDLPLSGPTDTLHLPIAGPLADPVGVSMGNPHAVFFVDDAEAVDLATLGRPIEYHALFPQRVNVEVASVLAPDRIRMRVWERGVGITQACGSGACATLVAAARRGLSDRKATLVLDGGELLIEWRADEHVIMTGPAVTSFVGEIDGHAYAIVAANAAAA